MSLNQPDYEDFHRNQKQTTLKYFWAKCTNPLAYDSKKAIVLSTADMEFKFSPQILQKAIELISKTHDFGYQSQDKSELGVIKRWIQQRYWLNNPKIQLSDLTVWSGMLHTFKAIVEGFVKKDESVLIFSPAYHMFFHIMKDLNVSVVEFELKVKNNRFFIDWEELEIIFEKSSIKLIVWCSPHNPSGRIWSKDELLQLCNIAKKYKSIIFSDEIYSDSIIDHRKFTSFLDVEESHDILIYANSHTKAFNCSGNGCSYTLSPNKEINNLLKNIVSQHMCFSNVFSRKLLVSCYQFGAQWLQNTEKYVQNNLKHLTHQFTEHLPKLIIFQYECSYLIVVDFKEYVKDSEVLRGMFNKYQIYPTYLSDFYLKKTASTMIRINLAINIKIVDQFCERVVSAMEQLQNSSKLQ